MLFEPRLRLGVTGLSRAGKTVFITSLIANLLQRGRMTQLRAEADGRLIAAAVQPHPDRETPRFDYESHLAALSANPPRWPESTRRISQIRVSLRYRPTGFLAGLTGDSTMHLDIVDYPGEWLLDLALLDQDFTRWSLKALKAAENASRAPHAGEWRALIAARDPAEPFEESAARPLAAAFTAYLGACRKAGLSGLAPGRFLMPGDMEGSPALTFCPLPPPVGRDPLHAEFARRFDAYKRSVVKPFFRNHFARLDRQIVLVDLMTALNDGPAAVADLSDAMKEVLGAFRPGRNSWLASILGRRIDRILFAATKADHLHHLEHDRLTAILSALLSQNLAHAAFRGAETHALAIAALRATVEQEGDGIRAVRGRLEATGEEAALDPGELPADPASVLAAARAADAGPAGTGWLDGAFKVMNFAPPRLSRGEGLPHIRLDRALEFLIGDRLT
ncbi:YcjX family protein [Pikeienuella piscinae]|uniref:YcjX family protein n=2 Tax=Pikeienuella piscinae TaxID=2748098 RepID=A0A7M3T7A4_9RHOB|nr:YcjX family protein [Pikeienuella piscinae]